jgi:hypothetical protein
MEKQIKLVVFNEHTLGYIFPEYPNTLQVLQPSVLRGSNLPDCGNTHINKSDNVRLATEQDFIDYRVSFKGYKNNPEYLYDKTTIEEIEKFKEDWGQSDEEIKSELEYDNDSDDLLNLDYFWDNESKLWFPKTSTLYSETEQKFADKIRYKN